MKDDYPNEHGPFRFHFGSQLVTAAGRENASRDQGIGWLQLTCVAIAGATYLTDPILLDPNARNRGFLVSC